MTDYERYGQYQGSDKSNIGLGLTLLLIGLGAGAVVGLLFAPKTGRQMRRSLRRKYEDARDVIEGLSEQASDMIDRGSGWAQAAKDKVSPLGNVIRRVR